MQKLAITTVKVVALATALVAFPACGDDEGEGDDGGSTAGDAELNQANAQLTANTVAQAVNTALSSGDGQAAALSLAGVGSASLALIVPAGQAGQQPASYSTASSALGAGTCECDATSCTFTDCGDDTGGFTMTGSISWANNTLLCDLTYSLNESGQTFSFSQTCDLTVTETSIDGTLTSAGDLNVSANGQNVTSTWDTSMTFNDVQTSNGCATSGSLDVSATISANGASYSGGGSVTFDGTGC